MLHKQKRKRKTNFRTRPWGVELYSKQWKYNYHASHWFFLGQFAGTGLARILHCHMKCLGPHKCWCDCTAATGIKQHRKSATWTQWEQHWELLPKNPTQRPYNACYVFSYITDIVEVCRRWESMQILSKRLEEVVVVVADAVTVS